MKKIYLASPWFKDVEDTAYWFIVNKLRSLGYLVNVPREHNIEGKWAMSNEEWGKATFLEDVKCINECDEVWVVNYGMYSDSGTAWECGYAYGIGKPIVQLLYKDNEVYSLMMINGCHHIDTIDGFLFDKPDDNFMIEQK